MDIRNKWQKQICIMKKLKENKNFRPLNAADIARDMQNTTNSRMLPVVYKQAKVKKSKLQFLKNINLPKIKTDKVANAYKNAKTIAKDALKHTGNKIGNCYDMASCVIDSYKITKENVLGVDITPSCIYVCKIDGLSGKRVLTSMTSVCMEGKFITDDILNNPDDYADSLRELICENDIKSKNVALSIPVSGSIVRMATISKMDDEEIKSALRFGSLWNSFMSADEKREDYSIFYQVIRRQKSSDTMDVLFIATRLSDVAIYTDIIKNAGLNPVIVDAKCFAISNAFQHKINNPDLSGPCAFLEFGIEESYAMVIDKDKVNIYEIAISDSHRAAMIDDICDDILLDDFVACYSAQLQKIITGHEIYFDSDDIKNLFVISTVAQTNTIIDKMRDSLENYRLTECNMFDCMKINDEFTISAKSAKENISAWAGAIGMALRKIYILGSAPANNNHANLLPQAGKYESQKRGKYLVNSLSAVASIAMLFFVVTTQESINKDNILLSRQLDSLQGVEQNYNKVAKENSRLLLASNTADYMEELEMDVVSRQRKLTAVHNYMNMVILDNVWLREMRFTSPDKLEIIGGSTEDSSIVEFMALLEEGNQFDKVSLKGVSEIREQSWSNARIRVVKSFTMEGKISDIPIIEDDYDYNKMIAGNIGFGT